ncbi:MAG: triose-phosphate isomerase, partial [Patescibacteria group bacterium]
GEISAAMLLAVGVSHVILGHSERRQYLHETDEIVNHKVRAALAASLTPIVCVGETLAERGEGVADLVLARQVIEGLKGIPLTTSQQQLIIAYEPVWVIGTGQAVEPSAAAHAAHVIRQALIDLFPMEIVDRQTRIIYGGSADADNIADFVTIAAIHGALVGTASLKLDTFMNLVERTAL